MTTRPRSTRLGEQLVHRLASTADHGREVRLRVGPVEPHLAGIGIGLAGEARQAAGQAAGEVQEVQLLDVAGDAAQLARQAGQQRIRAGLGSRSSEDCSSSRESVHVSLASSATARRRARRTVEQGQLSEEVAAAQRGDDGLLALHAGQHDLHGARADDVQRVAGIALVEDGLVAPEAATSELPGDVEQRTLVGALEQERIAQAGDDELLVHRRTMALPRVATSSRKSRRVAVSAV